MALTIAPLSPAVAGGLGTLGGRKVWIGFLQPDNSYPTGGYVFSPTLVGMAQIDQIFSGVLTAGNVLAEYIPVAGATGTLKFFVPTTGAEVANTTDLSAAKAPVIVVGV